MTLVFISVTGFVVLGGHVPRVPNPHLNFVDPFEGRPTPYGLTTALYRIIFSYGGFDNAFNVVNEVKVCSLSTANSYAAGKSRAGRSERERWLTRLHAESRQAAPP